MFSLSLSLSLSSFSPIPLPQVFIRLPVFALLFASRLSYTYYHLSAGHFLQELQFAEGRLTGAVQGRFISQLNTKDKFVHDLSVQ
jgi:hypothetical protein